MRCLLISDLHYTLKQFDWVLSVAEDFDVVVIAGDLIDISSHVMPQAQITVILTYLQRLREKTQIAICSGNHDLNARNGVGEKFSKWIFKAQHQKVHTDGDCLRIDGTLFTICPWWDGPKTREEVAAQLKRDGKKTKDRWFWVYHAPPDQSPTSWAGEKHIGDTDLVRWIEQFEPDIVLTGHIHQSPFYPDGSWIDQIGPTRIFNPGRQIGDCPTHIIFDTDEQEALWFSLEGNEIAQLNVPNSLPISKLTELPVWFR